MYKLNKNTNMTKLILRGNYLTKKFFKKNSKQTLIFLRAPKHFNIGKHKVSSFVNFKSYLYNVNYSLFISQFLLNKNFFFSILTLFHKLNVLYVTNSIKVKTKIKIK